MPELRVDLGSGPSDNAQAVADTVEGSRSSTWASRILRDLV